MKKLLLISAIFALMSCSTGTNKSTNAVINDTVKVDTTMVDSSAIDSTVCPD